MSLCNDREDYRIDPYFGLGILAIVKGGKAIGEPLQQLFNNFKLL
jgi:hypothetical protein